MTRKGHSLLRKIPRVLLGTLAAAAMIAAFYLAVVLGQPQEDPDRVIVSQSQPLLTASPAITLQSAEELEALLQAFPVPALYAVEGSGLTLTGGMCYDAAYGDGFARVAHITYEAESAQGRIQLEVQSIYPARALEFVPREDYRIAEGGAQPLAGMQAVRMENAQNIRLHAQAEDGLYVVTVPKMSAEVLAAVTRSLQLYGAKEDE